MLAHYQDNVDSIDRRLKIAERASQARSARIAGDGVASQTTAGHVEALDRFMAAITDEKLVEEGRWMMTAISSRNGGCQSNSPE
jgi:hypothetical protein